MEPWRGVHLTRARQVAELMEATDDALPAPEVCVRAQYDALRRSDPAKALAYLGHALPRREAVHWAAGLIDPGADARPAWEGARAWLKDPSDANRRAAYAAAQAMDPTAPERSLATAIFYSGGSIAPEDLPAVYPAPALANRLAVTSLLQAAWRTADPQGFFARALTRGEAIAEHGLDPIP